ncbi:DUF769 domain-containing protein, partial [Xylella fastidiosa]
MRLYISLCLLMFSVSVLLCGCSSGPIIDSRTGKPMMVGSRGNPDLGLKSFSVDFLGQYRVKHAFLDGSNISRCYPGSPSGNVRVVMGRGGGEKDSTWRVVRDGIYSWGGEPSTVLIRFFGQKIWNYRYKTMPDGSVQQKKVTWMSFDALCGAEFAGGSFIDFGIRNAASESIETHIKEAVVWVSAVDRDYQSNRFLEAPRTEMRWGNNWTWYRAYMHPQAPYLPAPIWDSVETWMTPIGNSGYYITVNFNFIEAARQKNTEDYQRAR